MSPPSQVSEDEFIAASKGIVAKLQEWTADLDDDQRTRRIYNEAITDAIEFVQVMATKNPRWTTPFTTLAQEMQTYLPLREVDP